MLHDVIILVPTFNFVVIKITLKHFRYVFFPLEGNFDIDAGDGGGCGGGGGTI